MRVSPKHPRYQSLRIRELLVSGMRDGLVAPQGLLAHGRGEAFDYLLGEKTSLAAKDAITAAAAFLLQASDPVISVNGNTGALVPDQISRLALAVPAKVEVNLFHRTPERARKIAQMLRHYGVNEILGLGPGNLTKIEGVSSERRTVDSRGIASSDVVLVALEDGDRTLALQNMGKKVIAIDLNPLSRTARVATVTIVDNIVRAFPSLVAEVRKLRHHSGAEFGRIVSKFDNRENLARATREMVNYLGRWNGR